MANEIKRHEFVGLNSSEVGCPRCHGDEWLGIPASMAQLCNDCGFVRVFHKMCYLLEHSSRIGIVSGGLYFLFSG